MARRLDGVPLKEYVEALLAAKDLKDQQRYDAQTDAVKTALLAQQTAMQAALVAQQTAVQAAQAAAEKAVNKAEVAAEKRFDAVNEFRGAYQDIIAQQMPRAEAEQRLLQLSDKIDDLKGSSRGGINALLGWLFAAAAVTVAVISLVTR